MRSEYLIPTLSTLLKTPGQPIIHRDLSWLQFNERVLAEARTSANPLLERLKFLAITASNLDEFFMIRYASLSQEISVQLKRNRSGARHLFRVRNSILDTVASFTAKQSETFDLIAAELAKSGIQLILKPSPGDPAFVLGKKVFDQHVLPNLSPPETFAPPLLSTVENLQFVAVFRNGVWFRIPKSLPNVFMEVSEATNEIFVFFLDDLLSSHMSAAFRLNDAPGFLRITRDGDLAIDLGEEDSESIPNIVRKSIGSRERGKIVRIQYAGEMTNDLLNQTINKLKIAPRQMIFAPTTLMLQGLWTVIKRMPEKFTQQPGLSLPVFKPRVPQVLQNGKTIFDELKQHDVLLHHPYDSFDAYVAFIELACRDSHVTSIRQTVYRMDALSPIIKSLKKAAKQKKIHIVIELRARFDELNNLKLAEELRQAGIEVSFGFGKLKLHAKVALITRTENGVEKKYTHLSTGNYNAATAREYEDLAILTANEDLGEDARQFFEAVINETIPSSFKQLVPAPLQLHKKLVALIKQETAAAKRKEVARIVAKVNALVDEAIIQELYLASQAGVEVDLIVRGACSLIPGVKNLSENIRVYSVVDRFLEHSRIYYFENSKQMFLSSADWMPRNFFSRMELAFPVLDKAIYQFVEEVIIPAYLLDTLKARELTPQGTWKKRTLRSIRATTRKKASPILRDKSVRAQFLFQDLGASDYKDTSLWRT
ncbi:MAG: polyphosphate kinase 1 [Bacteriovoracia bacterium]